MSETTGHWYQGWGGRRLWTLQRPHPDPIGGVLVLHGYSEHSGRYRHVIDALAERGFASMAPDHRGHGRSASLLGDMEDLDAVIEDWRRLADRLARLAPGRPLYVLAHSMGAMLAVRLLGRDRRWAGAVLNGTPVAVPDQISPIATGLARVLGGVAPWLPLQPFYDPDRASRDPAIAAASLADPLQYKGWIRAGTGSQMLGAIRDARAIAPTLRLPVLLTHGGVDPTVPVGSSAELHTLLGSLDKELHVFEGLQHEVHNEPERELVLARWTIWLGRRARALG